MTGLGSAPESRVVEDSGEDKLCRQAVMNIHLLSDGPEETRDEALKAAAVAVRTILWRRVHVVQP